MDKAPQSLPVTLTVVHHARTSWIGSIGSVCTCLMVGNNQVEMVATLAFVQISLMALAFATRKTDWTGQSLLATEGGLQVGTLFRDVRASDLRACELLEGGYQLRGRFLTLQLRVDGAHVAALGALLTRSLGAFAPAKKHSALRWMALGGIALFALWTLDADDPLDRGRLICLVLSIAAATAECASWLYYKRAGQRL